mgnify:CR=1 FL=1|jgi:hypothetical protein|tara:strand:- start:67 stop:792 length:726 start_codon:yes stop_codon:yes gene_type:complete
MADFTTAGLCGANPDFNSIMTAGVDLKDSIKGKLGGLGTFSSASDLAALAESKVATLTANVSGMIPELPSVPDVSLQAEITQLLSFNLSTPTGLASYTSKLSSITSSFGGALTSAGLSLDSLITSATSAIGGGGDLCAAVPNFKLPSGSTDAVQQAGEVLQATTEGVSEEQPTIVDNTEVTSSYSSYRQPTEQSYQPVAAATVESGTVITTRRNPDVEGGTVVTTTGVDEDGFAYTETKLV